MQFIPEVFFEKFLLGRTSETTLKLHGFREITYDRSLIRASSYEPGQPGWLGFRDLASSLFSLHVKYRCVHIRGRAGPVTEISVFATEISITGMKIFLYERSSPVTGTKLFK